MTPPLAYRGRFAPSPTGPLHAGSLVAALASWLDARAHGGTWLVRIEDTDTPRVVPGSLQTILQQLSACGLDSDETPTLQSERTPLYQQALERLFAQGLAYPCHCTRKDIALVNAQRGRVRPRHGELVYPGTCRPTIATSTAIDRCNTTANPSATVCDTQADGDPSACLGLTARAWRLRTDVFIENKPLAPVKYIDVATKLIAYKTIYWVDRRMGHQQQDVASDVGDVVLKRADGCFTYQLAVVVDDGAQGITHVVRGLDLVDNTARQVLLQQALGLTTPVYLHTPLVLGNNGEKLSKQNGALALDTANPRAALSALTRAAGVLGLPAGEHSSIALALSAWTVAWRHAWLPIERPRCNN